MHFSLPGRTLIFSTGVEKGTRFQILVQPHDLSQQLLASVSLSKKFNVLEAMMVRVH